MAKTQFLWVIGGEKSFLTEFQIILSVHSVSRKDFFYLWVPWYYYTKWSTGSTIREYSKVNPLRLEFLKQTKNKSSRIKTWIKSVYECDDRTYTNKQTPNQTNIKIEIVTLYKVFVIYINTKISNSMDTQRKQRQTVN